MEEMEEEERRRGGGGGRVDLLHMRTSSVCASIYMCVLADKHTKRGLSFQFSFFYYFISLIYLNIIVKYQEFFHNFTNSIVQSWIIITN